MIQIGPYTLENTLFVAPMAGVTDSVFRSLCLEHGSGYAVSEMISSETTLNCSRKTLHRVMRANSNLPHGVQIVGSDAHALAEAASFNVRNGAQIIDINMGCPAKKVCNKLAGSALLSDEKLVDKILASVVSAVDVPVTLKIRTGPDRENRNGVRIAQLAEKNGIQALAVHGRTRADRFKGEADYDTIAAIKSAVNIPVIANGDINSPRQARDVLQRTQADGLMIGRAAQGNPWVFSQIYHWLDTGLEQSKPSDEEQHSVLCKHVQGLHKVYGEYRGLRIARKHISWYCKNKRGAASFRNTVNCVETAASQLAMIDQFFAQPDSFETLALPEKPVKHQGIYLQGNNKQGTRRNAQAAA